MPDMIVGDTFFKKWNDQMVVHLSQSVLIVSATQGHKLGCTPAHRVPWRRHRGLGQPSASRSSNTNVSNKSPVSTLWGIAIVCGGVNIFLPVHCF